MNDNMNNNINNDKKLNTNANEYSSGGSPEKSPGKFYNSTNNVNSQPKYQVNEAKQEQSIRNNKFINQPEYNNPFSKDLSPIKRLNESVIDQPKGYTPSPIK